MRQIAISTLSNQNISSALLVYTYTADADRGIFFRVFLNQIAGNGNYTTYCLIQRLGAGSLYRAVPITTALVASGVTAAMLTTIIIPVKDTDVITVYVLGLAGDTITPDIITEVWEDDTVLNSVWTNAKAAFLDEAVSAAKTLVDGAITATKIASDAITSAKFDENTAFPLKAADSGATQIARVGADGDTLETLSDQLDSVQTLGAGAISWTVTVNDGTDPLDGADVWISTDLAGVNVIARGTTDDSGQVTFMLDAGTYYAWKQLAGYQFTNPETMTVA